MGSRLLSRAMILWKVLEDKFARLTNSSYRLLIPFLIVFSAKLFSGLFIYKFLNMGSSNTYWMTVGWDTEGQNEILKSVAQNAGTWPYLFLGWDSAWYLSIMMKGYAFSSKSFAFFPGFPFFSWMINQILLNPAYSLVVFAFVLGILWVPLCQLVAEYYFARRNALQSTLLYALFPYVFLFTTVAYAEGLFLFCTLGAWYFFKKMKISLAVLFAAIATISRPPGIVIILPMAFETIRMHRHRDSSPSYWKILSLSIPFLCFLSWFLYCRATFNSWVPTGWSGMYSFRLLVFDILPQKGLQPLLEYFQIWPLSPAFMIFLLVAPLLILALVRIDKALALYSAAYFLGVLAGGGLASIPRFISFIFPLWLPLAGKLSRVKRSNLLTLMICAAFLLVGLLFWLDFLNGEFVA